MTTAGLSKERLARMREVLSGHVERGEVPGLVALVARRGEVYVEALGTISAGDRAAGGRPAGGRPAGGRPAGDGAAGGGEPMRRDAIFRIASVSKPIAAAAAMTLVEECRLRLDDPVDDLLPELADRRVLRRSNAPLDDTVPARRPITLRDLLTFRLGIGAVMAPPGSYPIQQAMDEAGLSAGPDNPSIPPDEWMRRLGALPLVSQPGEKWAYHTGADALGVLLARATGQPLEELLRQRVLEPLGMHDTGFHVPAGKLDRLPPAYRPDPETGALVLTDDPRRSPWASPPVFPSAGGGLVSTADDLLAFYAMMLNQGRHDGRRLLSRPAVELMTTDHLTEEQRADNALFFQDAGGWGLGMHVVTRHTDLGVPGGFGWNGGTGTSAYADPAEGLVGILLTQRGMTSPAPPAVCRDFWTCAYAALDD